MIMHLFLKIKNKAGTTLTHLEPKDTIANISWRTTLLLTNLII